MQPDLSVRLTPECSITQVADLLRKHVGTWNAERRMLGADQPPSPLDLRMARALRMWIAGDPLRFEALESLLGLQCDLYPLLLDDLPWRMGRAGMIDEMIEHARGYAEIFAPDAFLGDLATNLAEAGRIEEARLQSQANLERFSTDPWIHVRAAEVHEVLREYDLAESMYVKALSLAPRNRFTRNGILERLVPMLDKQGKTEEARMLLQEEEVYRKMRTVEGSWEDDDHMLEPVRRESPKVGRNDPCPCGSGKKYKHCCMR